MTTIDVSSAHSTNDIPLLRGYTSLRQAIESASGAWGTEAAARVLGLLIVGELTAWAHYASGLVERIKPELWRRLGESERVTLVRGGQHHLSGDRPIRWRPVFVSEDLEKLSPWKELKTERVSAVRRGLLTAEKAEEWARKKGEPSFEPQPDPIALDPMTEPHWTLAMALAWIIWRTPESVREQWSEHRRRTNMKPWKISINDVWRKSASQEPDNAKPTAQVSLEELWRELRGSKLLATGLDNSLPANGRRASRRSIPPFEWIDLSWVIYHSGEADSVAHACDIVARYNEVRVSREDVVTLWNRRGEPTGPHGVSSADVSPPGAIEKERRIANKSDIRDAIAATLAMIERQNLKLPGERELIKDIIADLISKDLKPETATKVGDQLKHLLQQKQYSRFKRGRGRPPKAKNGAPNEA